MTERTHISRFTPSAMPAETLEEIFVQRQDSAVDTVDRIRDSALRDNRHYLLFIGPRGCGKTHFVSLIYHRVQKIQELDDTLRIAWLTEDETATSFLDLQVRVYRALNRDYPEEFPGENLERLYDHGPDGGAQWISERIIGGLGERSGLIIVENLDQLFDDMGREGQHDWRAFLQETGRFAILSTAQQLFPGVSSRDAPFFGFFQTSYFDQLTTEEGRQLLVNIARLQKDTELLAFLHTPRAAAHAVRVLQHLSGGNHRVYVVLSEFITRDSLDELIGPFERTLDELTPYYQERLRWLSAQQRKIVEHLCLVGRPISVNDIARALFSTNQTIARQLKDLKEKRYVRSSPRGRESLYELTEPLMRMAMELKEQRGGPIRLVVDFLRVWYERDDLAKRLRGLPKHAIIERMHVQEALRRIDAGELNPCVAALLRDLESLQLRDNQEAIEILEELAETCGRPSDWMELCSAKSGLNDHDGAIEAATKVIDSEDTDAAERVRALAKRGSEHMLNGQLSEAIVDFSRVAQIDDAPRKVVAAVLAGRGFCNQRIGDVDAAVDDFSSAIEMVETPDKLTALALVARGEYRHRSGDIEGAIKDFTRLISLEGLDVEYAASAHHHRGYIELLRQNTGAAIDDFTCVVEMNDAPTDRVAVALMLRGCAKMQIEDMRGAFDDYTRVIELEDADVQRVVQSLVMRANVQRALGDIEAGVRDSTRAIESKGATTEWVADARHLRAMMHVELGDVGHAIQDITESATLSPDDPDIKYTFVEITMAGGQWGDGWRELANCLERFPIQELHNECFDPLSIIRIIFTSTHKRAVWCSRVNRLVELFANADVIQRLGDALVRSLRELVDGEYSERMLADWRAAWHEAASEYEEFDVPLRLFDVGLKYIQSGDPRTLLDLPLEQRAVLEQLFEIEAGEAS